MDIIVGAIRTFLWLGKLIAYRWVCVVIFLGSVWISFLQHGLASWVVLGCGSAWLVGSLSLPKQVRADLKEIDIWVIM